MHNDKREYQRGEHLNCTVKVSVDGKNYKSGEVSDISSGGIALISTDKYNVGDKLFFELLIEGFLSEFLVMTEGKIMRCTALPEYYLYGIKFIGLSEDMKIRIDMNIVKDRMVESNPYTTD